MKKLILLLTALLALLLLLPAWISYPQDQQKPQWSVESYTVTIYKTGGDSPEQHEEYYLYYGTDETKRLDRLYDNNRVKIGIYVYYVSPELDVNFEAPKRWYLQVFDSRKGFSKEYAVYDPEIWGALPGELKTLVQNVPIENTRVVLIYYSVLSQSIEVFYDPKYSQDKQFYKKTCLKIISRYVANSVKQQI